MWLNHRFWDGEIKLDYLSGTKHNHMYLYKQEEEGDLTTNTVENMVQRWNRESFEDVALKIQMVWPQAKKCW